MSTLTYGAVTPWTIGDLTLVEYVNLHYFRRALED